SQTFQLNLTYRAPARHAPRALAEYPVLILPGLFLSADITAHTLQPSVAWAGFPCYSLSMRGHGSSQLASVQKPGKVSLKDYKDDVMAAIAHIDALGRRRPVVVAHSAMCNVIGSIIADNEELPGVIYLNGTPTRPKAMMGRVMMQHPFRWMGGLIANRITNVVRRSALLSEYMLTEETPATLAGELQSKLSNESRKVIMNLFWGGASKGSRCVIPSRTALVGDEADGMITPDLIRKTADDLGVTASFTATGGHVGYHNRDWRAQAELVVASLLRWFGVEDVDVESEDEMLAPGSVLSPLSKVARHRAGVALRGRERGEDEVDQVSTDDEVEEEM
ncbi:hypothetical protein KIPB_006448, partial [Kipferlia bialata]